MNTARRLQVRRWAWLLPVLLSLGLSAAEGPTLQRFRPVSFADVRITDTFWAPRRDTNRRVSIAVNLENLEKSGNLENLRLAARRAINGYQGPVFMDSDVYKALEAAAYTLATDPDPVLENRLDEIIAVLAAAQHPDGYLNSYYTVKEPGVRWVNLRDNHELYCAGHLFEAAVAHQAATGRTNFLQVACRLADHIDATFGPPPKRLGYPGHPEIELALVKLWRATGEGRYLKLAQFFVENRGRQFFAAEHHTPLDRYDGSYWQDDVPICDHRNIKGHAVRAAYLMSGATDVAMLRDDGAGAPLLSMIRRVWRNTTERNLYLTGGIGPSAHNEGFTEDYDLPNLSAYQETCATIALAQWAHRLALAYGDASPADILERALYNGMLAGVSLDGRRFFYVNPLESRGTHHRSEWFGCACCPPNVARTLAALGGYAYATTPSGDAVVNLYLQGSVRLPGPQGASTIEVTTEYPYDGRVALRWRGAGDAPRGLWLRIPAWCEGARARVAGREIPAVTLERGYLVIRRTWAAEDAVELELPMPVRRTLAHPRVKADRGAVALERGPLVYCLEQIDHADPLDRLYLDDTAEFAPRRAPGLLGGTVLVTGTARVADPVPWTRTLYRAAAPARTVALTAVPYHAWDNRTAGAMRVWIPTTPPVPASVGIEAQARVTLSWVSGNAQPEAIHDGREIEGSRKHPGELCHWWPHKGGQEWVQYTWDRPVRLAGAQVYWFDDTGVGECRLPEGWSMQYLDGTDWKEVPAKGAFGVNLDRWDEVRFDPVSTTSVRLSVRQRDGWASGIHEWRVTEAED